jgi:hypothetical protein
MGVLVWLDGDGFLVTVRFLVVTLLLTILI